MANAEDNLSKLLENGIMPAVAVGIVAWGEARTHTPLSPSESQSEAEISDGDRQRMAIGWYYDPLVPNDLKRILDAREA